MPDPSPVDFRDKQVFMAHGAGGEASRRLVEGLFRPLFSNPTLDVLSDAAVLPGLSDRLAITVDSFVVQPLVFAGGSIGELAINGTVNDLAVSGARPLAIAAAFILEAGLSADVLRREVEAMAAAARRVGVHVVTGDTKVVEHGKADGMYITTTGVGLIDARANLQISRVAPGDKVLLSGPIGSHGMA
ncbi:MAG TPA: AIR synthase related protein, partial [Pirellulales bacterium]|nr:AIR synthase related protein [Pirellulales bacterium]